jgi:hypothetical protein
MTCVIGCDYSKKVGLIEKILVFVLIFLMFLNFHLEQGKPFSHLPADPSGWISASVFTGYQRITAITHVRLPNDALTS